MLRVSKEQGFTVILHPGMHKTGTTWLQRQVFSDSRLFNSVFTHHEVNALLVQPHDLLFSADPVVRAWKTRSSPNSNAVDIISSELLSGNPLLGSRDSKALADRLKLCFGSAKVLLTIRSQVPITRSLYSQYVKRGGRLTIDKFLMGETLPGYDGFNPNILQFDRLTRYYEQLFGRESILVLPQELLTRDPETYLRHLLSFAGVDDSFIGDFAETPRRGVSPPASSLSLIRFSNLFRQTPLNPGSISSLRLFGDLLYSSAHYVRLGSERAALALDQKIAERLSGVYENSNWRLQRYAPCDLKQLGYPMARMATEHS